MYDELIEELRRHHCDAKEDDTQEVCEECAYDVIIEDKSVPSGIASVCVCGLMNRAADAIEELSVVVRVQKAVLEKFPHWTPVSERLPKGADKSGELCENVWLFFDDGNVYPGWMNGITEKVYYLDNYSGSLMTAPISRVKMWQPRPEPPEKESES